jgi:hypothetical protein
MNGMLFPIGAAIGSWKTKVAFEEAYRTNHVDVLNISFTNFSLLINFVLIIFSLNFIGKIYPNRSRLSRQNVKLLLLFLAIPISLNQLVIDTIEIYTFFGISLALYVSFLQVRRESIPKLVDYFLVSASFLFTVGIRMSLAIFIIPIFFLIGFHKYRRNNLFSELIVPLIASSIALMSYLPLIVNYVELNSTIEMYRSLGGLNFNAETLHRNLTVLILNFGFALFLVVPTLVLILRRVNQKSVDAEHALLLFWLSLAIVHIFLFLFNNNGFPKYLIPVFPLLLLLIDRTFRLENLDQLKYLRHYKKTLLALISITYMALGIINYNNYQSHSRFDTREIIMQILPDSEGWMRETTANLTVITELSRGKYGFTYDEVLNRISPFNRTKSDCKELLILSTRELGVEDMSNSAQVCGLETGKYSIIQISPYRNPSLNRISDEWLGFLSLGTPVDPNRNGFGPLYMLFIQRDWTFESDLLSNCASSQFCKILQ